MTSVTRATEIVLSKTPDYGEMSVSLEKSPGQVLAEDLVADRDQPPFDRVMMDGIAIRYEDFAGGNRKFRIAGIQAAGKPALKLKNPLDCLEVMTGAILPEGADTVVRSEDLKIAEKEVEIQVENLKKWQNIHARGYDRLEGDVLVEKGTVITAAVVGIAASVGMDMIEVKKTPRVCAISTGDELVNVNKNPLPYQIRRSNAHVVDALLKPLQIDCDIYHFSDKKEEILNGIQLVLTSYDVLIISGAVSAGKFDHIPDALVENGVERHFHKVEQRPGKPFWFGTHPEGTVIFALPGNPVSTFLCTCRYVIPFLRKAAGLEPFENLQAVLGKDYTFDPALTLFLPVRILTAPTGERTAYPQPGHGSGDFSNLQDADGFLELPADRKEFKKGEAFPFWEY